MQTKEEVYEFIKNIIESEILDKGEVLDIFVKILRDYFSIEEMLNIMNEAGTLFPKIKKDSVKKKIKDDVLSYPSVIGIPLSLVYEKIFEKWKKGIDDLISRAYNFVEQG